MYFYWKFILKDGKEVQNQAIFKSEYLNELLNLVNKQFKKEFDLFKSDPDLIDCMDSMSSTYKPTGINELYIEIDEDRFIFKRDLEMGSACMNVGSLYAELPITKMEKYIK